MASVIATARLDLVPLVPELLALIERGDTRNLHVQQARSAARFADRLHQTVGEPREAIAGVAKGRCRGRSPHARVRTAGEPQLRGGLCPAPTSARGGVAP